MACSLAPLLPRDELLAGIFPRGPRYCLPWILRSSRQVALLLLVFFFLDTIPATSSPFPRLLLALRGGAPALRSRKTSAIDAPLGPHSVEKLKKRGRKRKQVGGRAANNVSDATGTHARPKSQEDEGGEDDRMDDESGASPSAVADVVQRSASVEVKLSPSPAIEAC